MDDHGSLVRRRRLLAAGDQDTGDERLLGGVIVCDTILGHETCTEATLYFFGDEFAIPGGYTYTILAYDSFGNQIRWKGA